MKALVRLLTLRFLDSYRDWGILMLRLGIGGIFAIYHGSFKIVAGSEFWGELGKALQLIGVTRVFEFLHIPFVPVIFGFLAAATEFFGGIVIILGLFTRLACLALLGDMTVASISHLIGGDGFAVAAHPVALGLVFLSLFVMGPGKFSLDELLNRWSAGKPAASAPKE